MMTKLRLSFLLALLLVQIPQAQTLGVTQDQTVHNLTVTGTCTGCGGGGAGAFTLNTPGCLQAQSVTRFLAWAHFATTNCGSTETTGASTSLPNDYSQQILTHSGTLKNLYCVTDTSMGADSIVFTVRTGTSGSGSDSIITCTITGSNTSCTDLSHTVSSTAGQYLSIKAVSSATTGTRGIFCAVEND